MPRKAQGGDEGKVLREAPQRPTDSGPAVLIGPDARTWRIKVLEARLRPAWARTPTAAWVSSPLVSSRPSGAFWPTRSPRPFRRPHSAAAARESLTPRPLRLKVAAREAPGSLRPPPHVSRGPLGPHPPSRPAPEAPGGDSASGSGMGGLSLQAEARTLFTKGTYGAKNNDPTCFIQPRAQWQGRPGHRTDRPLPTLHPCSRAGKRQGPRRPRTGKGPGGAWSLAAWSL